MRPWESSAIVCGTLNSPGPEPVRPQDIRNVPSAAYLVTRLAPGAKLWPSVMKISPPGATTTSVGSLSSGGSPAVPRSPMVRRRLPWASNFTT